MMQDLKVNINRDSDHYKALKQGLLNTRREFISEKKQSYFEDSSSSSEEEDDEENEDDDEDTNDENNDDFFIKTEDMTSTDKVAQWFEKRQQNSELSRPSKSFLLDIFQPSEGQTEDELEAEIHRKDTEQMLKNSRSFYEKFLKFAENDFAVTEAAIGKDHVDDDDDDDDDGEEVEDDGIDKNAPMITESKENAIKEENRRLDAELDKCTEMFHDYLKSCDNTTEALNDIEKAMDRFCGKTGESISNFQEKSPFDKIGNLICRAVGSAV